ncbi:MAG: hypothetical protein A2437_00090 [Bacteroidetes bacterium RIFOXYC2_FULL_40_12]|nr:MAG: hypothetical protein A2437_00090 [Bacteroidetes bacterium RIFOXYC2_FULL_40_12]
MIWWVGGKKWFMQRGKKQAQWDKVLFIVSIVSLCLSASPFRIREISLNHLQSKLEKYHPLNQTISGYYWLNLCIKRKRL